MGRGSRTLGNSEYLEKRRPEEQENCVLMAKIDHLAVSATAYWRGTFGDVAH
jgi:hypothetical protein